MLSTDTTKYRKPRNLTFNELQIVFSLSYCTKIRDIALINTDELNYSVVC